MTAGTADPNPSNNYITETTTVNVLGRTLVVTNTDGGFSDGSLRWAIESSNADSGDVDRIHFNIPGTGLHTIAVTSVSGIFEPVIIDATTQPGFTGTPIIELNGAATNIGQANSPDAFFVGASGVTIKGFVVNRFGGNAISLFGSNNVVEGNYLGTNVAGTGPGFGNLRSGVFVGSGSNNRIGGTTAAQRNVVASSGFSGVALGGSGTTKNVVQGNYIGTDASGTVALPNGGGFTLNSGATGNVIGGTEAGAGNLISGNTGAGVNINSGATGNAVQGNRIGTNAAGTAALPNTSQGIFVAAANTAIGGSGVGGNLISGNAAGGVSVNSAGSGTIIEGNLIGTNAAGTAAIGHGTSQGINISAANVRVGGTTPSQRNVISGGVIPASGGSPALNSNGIALNSTSAVGNVIVGNYIGTNAAGTAALPNNHGIAINSGASGTTIGGTSAGSGNVLSGNNAYGIQVNNGSSNTSIRGNFIGTDATGSIAVPNGLSGVLINAASTTVGGVASQDRNLISGNTFNGLILIDNAAGAQITGNYIGTTVGGASPLPNGSDGINVSSLLAASQIAANIIAFNGRDGVRLIRGTHLISGNSIFSNGALGIDLEADGVTANDAGDGDTGANNRQNFPVLATASGGVSGTLNSTANTTFTIQFFSNSVCDATGNGEGETLLGTVGVTTNAAGDATISTFAAPAGAIVTAVAFDSSNNTSEFAACVLAGAVGPVTFGVTNTNDSGAGSLRQAILNANLSTGVTNQIRFSIPGTGPFTIAPTSVLPTITNPVVIDGTTQPGWNGTPIVELNGAAAGGTGLSISAGGNSPRPGDQSICRGGHQPEYRQRQPRRRELPGHERRRHVSAGEQPGHQHQPVVDEQHGRRHDRGGPERDLGQRESGSQPRRLGQLRDRQLHRHERRR